MRSRDLLLILVALAGIVLGVIRPDWFSPLSPHVVYGLMTILYMSFLRMDFKALVRVTPGGAFEVGFWSLVKLFILPAAAWALARITVPEFALPVLLLTGTSTGVTAPFFASLLGAHVHRVLQLVVLSSLLAPLTLPLLVQVFMGSEMSMPFGHMVKSLMFIIFIPMGLALLTRLYARKVVVLLDKVQFPLTLVLFFAINLGVFARYANFLAAQRGKVLLALLVAFALGLAYALSGHLLAKLNRNLDGLTGGVGMTIINNVVIIVFAADFFGPEAPLLAALYMIPLFLMLIPLRWLAQKRTPAPAGAGPG